MRIWQEVSVSGIQSSSWVLYAKGGAFRRWYGNIEHAIDWRNDAQDLKDYRGSGMSASKYFGKNTFTWSKITSSLSSFRSNDSAVFFDDANPALVISDNVNPKDRFYILGLLNSTITRTILAFLSPTLNCQTGDVRQIPTIPSSGILERRVVELVETNISISKQDWDSQETSWILEATL